MSTFKFLKVRLNDTKSDKYQRPLDVPRAKSYAETFDKGKFQVPVISKREDGSLWRVDGNTRIEAAIMAGFGNAEFLCQVFEGLSYEEEAKMFDDLNKFRKGVSIFRRFIARLEWKDPIALEIARIVHGCGLRIVPGGNGYVSVYAVDKIESAHRNNENLRETLIVLKEWGGVDPQKFDGLLISTLSSFLVVYPSIDTEMLIKSMVPWAPRTLLSHLKSNRIAFSTFSRHDADVMAYRNIYNKRFSKHPLPQTTGA